MPSAETAAWQLPALASQHTPLLPVVFVLGFLWLSCALGSRVLVWVGAANRGTVAERGAIAIGLGAGLLQFVPIGLGAVGLLGTTSLQVSIGVIAFLFSRDLVRVAIQIGVQIRHYRRPPVWLLGWMAVLVPVLGVQLLIALTPTVDTDGVVYHLTAPKRWLESGSLDYLATYPQSNSPMGVEMLYTIGLVFGGDISAKCLHLALGVLGAVGLFLCGRRLGGRTLGAVTATLYLVGPVGVIGTLGTAFIEGAVSFSVAAAALAWVVWFQERDAGWLRCAAVLAGVAVTFKLTCALLPLALAVLTVLVLLDEQRRRGSERKVVSASIASTWQVVPLLAAPVVPWLIRSVLLTGNPVFPLFAQWIPTRDFSPATARVFDEYNRYLLWGTKLVNNWTLDERKLGLLALGVLLSAIVSIVCVIRLRSFMQRAAAFVFLGTALLQLYAVGLYVRYWIPMMAVLVLAVLLLCRPLLSRRWIPAALIASTLVVSALNTRTSLQQFEPAKLARMALNQADRRVFVTQYQPLYPLYETANRELPPDSRILLSEYCSGFYLDRTTFCADHLQDAIRFTDWNTMIADLNRLGVTHIIAPTSVDTSTDAPSLDTIMRGTVGALQESQKNRLVDRLIHTQAHSITQTADHGLYVIDGPLMADVDKAPAT
jgi:hypothetical protein